MRSTICVCGAVKEHRERRYCDGCAAEKRVVNQAAHTGKGTGPRKFYGGKLTKNATLRCLENSEKADKH